MSVIRASAKALNATALSARLLSKLSLATGHRPRFDPYRGHLMALSNVARREMIGTFAAGGPSSRTENC